MSVAALAVTEDLTALSPCPYSCWLEFGYDGRISHVEHLAVNASTLYYCFLPYISGLRKGFKFKFQGYLRASP